MKRIAVILLLSLSLLALILPAQAWGPERFYESQADLPASVQQYLKAQLMPGEQMLSAHRTAPYIFLLSKTDVDGRRLLIFEEQQPDHYSCLLTTGLLPEYQNRKADIVSGFHTLSLRYGEAVFFTFSRCGEDWLLSQVEGQDNFSVGPYAIKAHQLGKVFTDDLSPSFGRYQRERRLRHITAQDLPDSFAKALDWLSADGLAVVHNSKPTDRLHLRTRPDRSASSLGKFYNGTPVQVLANQGAWLKVRIGTLEGYMMSQYLHSNTDPFQVQTAFPALYLREGRENSPRYDKPKSSAATIPNARWGYALGDIIGVIEEEWYILMNGAGELCFMRQEWFWGGNG